MSFPLDLFDLSPFSRDGDFEQARAYLRFRCERMSLDSIPPPGSLVWLEGKIIALNDDHFILESNAERGRIVRCGNYESGRISMSHLEREARYSTASVYGSIVVNEKPFDYHLPRDELMVDVCVVELRRSGVEQLVDSNWSRKITDSRNFLRFAAE